MFHPGVSGTPAPEPPGWDFLGRLRFALYLFIRDGKFRIEGFANVFRLT